MMSPHVEPEALRDAMSRFPTGVTVVSAIGAGGPGRDKLIGGGGNDRCIGDRHDVFRSC